MSSSSRFQMISRKAILKRLRSAPEQPVPSTRPASSPGTPQSAGIPTSSDPIKEIVTGTEAGSTASVGGAEQNGSHPAPEAASETDEDQGLQQPGTAIDDAVQEDSESNSLAPGGAAAGLECPEEPPASEQRTPENRAAELWDLALYRLQERSPELILNYHPVVSSWLEAKGRNVPGLRRPSVIGSSDKDIDSNEGSAQQLLNRVIDVMCEESELAESDVEDDDITSNTESIEHRIAFDAESLNKALRSGFKAYPYASIAWAVSTITLENLLAAQAQTEPTCSQIISVVSKMEWYIGLFRLFFWTDRPRPPSPSSSLPVDNLIDLYESVLAYHMRAAAWCLPEHRNLGNNEERCSQPQTDEIGAREDSFIGSFDEVKLQFQLDRLLETETETKQDESPVAQEIQDVLAKLNVHRQQISSRDNDKHSTGELLYDLATKTPEFEQFVKWGEEDHCRILWVNGCPGAGKSMLLRTAVSRLPIVSDKDISSNKNVAYFLCDNTRWRQADALSAVKGLIYGVLQSQPDLTDHLHWALQEWEGVDFLEDFYALSTILLRIIQDQRFVSTYFVVGGTEEFVAEGDPDLGHPVLVTDEESIARDPLDERGLAKLLRLISTIVGLTDRIKWVLSVDHERCHAELTSVADDSKQHIVLDSRNTVLHNDISQIVHKYAARMIGNDTRYHRITKEALTEKLRGAPSNFLWTDMALAIVRESTVPWNAADKLDGLIKATPDIVTMYAAAHHSINELPDKDAAYCNNMLSAMAVAYRPLLVSELVTIIELPPEVDPVAIITSTMPVFLEICEGTVYFKHVSARDFIRRSIVRKQGLNSEHFEIANRCLKLVLERLNRSHIHTRKPENPVDYTTTMWVKHLSEPDSQDPVTIALAAQLLGVHLIEWLVLLEPREMVPKTLSMMRQLNAAVSASSHTLQDNSDGIAGSFEIIREATMFMQLWNRPSESVSPKDRLLFATDLPNLRRALVPRYFPWLECPPAVGLSNSWDSCLQVLSHKDWVRGCCFSPDGRLVASASDDCRVRIWDAQTGSLQQVLGEFTDYARGVAMSHATTPKDRVVLAAFERYRIKAWDVTTGEPLVDLPSGTEDRDPVAVNCIALSPAADKLAAARDAGLAVWDMPDATRCGMFAGDGDSVRCVEFSPDGKLLASTAGSEITIWKAETGEAVCTLPMGIDQPEAPQEEEGPGRDEASRAESAPSAGQLGHTSGIDGLAFSPDSKFLASGSDDRTARVWNIETRKTESILDYHTRYVNSVSFSSDGTYIATGSSDESIAIWKCKSPGNWGSGETRTQPDRVLKGHTSHIWKVSFSTRDTLLASVSSDEDLRIWDIDRVDEETCETALPDHSTDVGPGPGHGAAVSCVAISEDGKTIASASYDGVVCLWDGETGLRQCTADKSHGAEVLSMTFSPDGERLVTSSIDRSACVWEVAKSTKTLLTPSHLVSHDDWVRDAKFDPYGKWVATGSDDRRVRVYNVSNATGGDIEPSTTLREHTDYVFSVAFSPDAARLASGGDDCHLMVWRIDSDTQITLGKNLSDDQVNTYIRAVAFSADGRQVVSASRDGTIAIWRPDSDSLRCRIVKMDGDFGPCRSMRIDQQYPNVLLTELGALYVGIDGNQTRGLEEEEPVACPALPPWRAGQQTPPGWLPFEVDQEGMLTTGDGERRISLPPYLRATEEPFSCRVQGNMVVIGCTSGQVLLFKFRDV